MGMTAMAARHPGDDRLEAGVVTAHAEPAAENFSERQRNRYG